MSLFNIKDGRQQPEISPASTDSDLLSFLDTAFKDSEQFMRPQRNRWRRNEKLFRGKHLVALNNDVTTPQIQLQLVLKTIETERPTVAASIPKYGALPRDIDDVLIASVVNQIKEGYENKGDSLESALQDITFNYKHDGNAIWSHLPVFDSKGDLIDFTFDALDIFGWFPSPDSTDVDIFTNSSYQIFAKVMSLKDIKATYGVNAQAESNLGMFESDKGGRGSDNNNSFTHGQGTTNANQGSCHALVKQIFFNDQKNIDKYPTGRTITWIGQIIPEKFDRPIWGDWRPKKDSEFTGFMPFKMAKNHGRKHSLFGMGEPEVIETMSHSANEQASAIALNIMLTGNNQRRIDPEFANTTEIEIPRGPGADIIARANDIELLKGLPVQPSMFAFLESLIAFTQEGSGATRELEGGKPAGVDSGRGILALQRQSVNRLEELTRSDFSRPMKAMVEFELWAIQQWSNTVTVRQDAFQESLPADNETTDAITVSQAGEFRFTKINFESINKNTKFDIEIEQGHVFPEGSLAQFEFYQGLFTEGLLPPEYLIQHAPIKNKATIMAWVKNRDPLKAIAQQEEAAVKEFSTFTSLVKESNRMAEQDPPVPPEEFANTLTAMNLSGLINQFKSYLETNEWLSMSSEYKEIILQVFLETPQEDREIAAQSETSQTQTTNGDESTDVAAMLQLISQQQG